MSLEATHDPEYYMIFSWVHAKGDLGVDNGYRARMYAKARALYHGKAQTVVRSWDFPFQYIVYDSSKPCPDFYRLYSVTDGEKERLL